MTRARLHRLLAISLVLQGSLAAFAASSSRMDIGCCAQSAGAQSNGVNAHQPHCPCSPDHACATDCALLYASTAVAWALPLVALAFGFERTGLLSSHDASLLYPRNNPSPIRPPIA